MIPFVITAISSSATESRLDSLHVRGSSLYVAFFLKFYRLNVRMHLILESKFHQAHNWFLLNSM